MKESQILSAANKLGRVVNLGSKNVLTGFFFSRQTYYMVFLWVLTWYSYWIFMKNQITAINIIGAVISGGLLVFSRFLPIRNFTSKKSKFSPPKIGKQAAFTPVSLGPADQTDNENSLATCIPPIETSSSSQVETSTVQPYVLETQEFEPESVYLASKSFKEATEAKTEKLEPKSKTFSANSQQVTLESSGCPKNLSYYTQRPRPKQTPDECMTCKNLIACVCLTSS